MLISLNAILVARKLLTVFKPSNLYKTHAIVLAKVLNFLQKQYTQPQDIRNLKPEQMNETQRNNWTTGLSMAVVSREFCFFWARKIAEFNAGSLQLAFHLGNYLILLALTTSLFAYENWGLSKIDISAFSLNGSTSFFDYFYYAFYGLFLQKPSGMTPLSTSARCLDMIEMLFSFFLITLFITLFVANKRKVDEAEIANTVNDLQQQAQSMQEFVFNQFSFSIQQATDELTRLNRDVSKAITKLRHNKRRIAAPVIEQSESQ
jgi:hypothetical protein